MEKGGWAPQAARRELGNFLLSSALLLGTARAQGRRLPVLPSAICLFPSGVCPERRVGLRARRGSSVCSCSGVVRARSRVLHAAKVV